MKILYSVILFYKKLVIPSLLMAILSGFAFKYVAIAIGNKDFGSLPLFSLSAAAFSYLIFSLAFQFFIYEVKNSNEYYFYFNLGLNKGMLWLSNLTFSLMPSIFILFL